ncbi:efflux RND transporter periplasmic adaptor subunit [Microbaculum marinisediminis]|uniref:Efflux RND transporter periplasmic adaptor subunit n=1 Tax=Microbaculum marinisediminis TaxID=2931392 RepID=A0AAW5QWU8_9HYPH|nr:efflux RND transporter periplasmic adaptor subunit [Microbaculum sp. A6E488]MCT8971994.1 efflux RND transporter periplasmic adaptor subunit [Microbaculum sp. A6E488]
MRTGTNLARVCGIAALALAASGALAQDSTKTAPAVVVAAVKNEDVTTRESFVGRVEAIQSVDLQARVEGYVEEVAFQEGALVKTGKLLFSLDKGPYEASLAEAQAALKSAEASLEGGKAKLKDADLTLERQQTLIKSNTVSQAMVDQAQASRDEAAANVDSANASIAQANANIQSAQLNLSYTEIASPIDGRIGKANYTKGNLVNTASGTLATVIQMDPIRVVFSISDRTYLQVVEQLKKTSPDKDFRDDFRPTIQLANGDEYQYPGQISFIDNTVDKSTGTIAIRANFKNPDYELVPGQFVEVTVQVGATQLLPVIPVSAILQDKDGPYVLMVDTDNRAQIRRIKTGEHFDNKVAVTGGLEQGDTIIVEGIQKVTAGEAVKPQTASSGS